MRLSETAIKRPITTIMVVLMVIILGIVSLNKLSIDLLPDINLPVAVVITTYPGAGPEEVESLITKPIEEVVGSVENVDTISSTSEPNVSTVIVKFNWGTDLDFATLRMREKIDMIKDNLPSGIDNGPTVMKFDPSMMPVLVVQMWGDADPKYLKQTAEDTVKRRLERLEGVASVRIVGGLERQIRVFLSPEKIEGYGLSLQQVMQVLKSENLNMPLGDVDYGNRELLMRMMGEFKDISEIENIVISNRNGSIVRLKDIARIEDATEDVEDYSLVNGKPSLRLAIQKQSDANTVKVAETAKNELERIKKELPSGIEFFTILDQSDFINRSINNVTQNAITGAILAVIILYIFLRNVRVTFIIATAIPISIIATFVLMYFMGLTLNLMTLGGLALGVGMLVDNSIVVLENIYRHREEGLGKMEAANVGAQEVGMAIIASTLTTVAVFLPVIFVEGITGHIFKELSLTVTFSLLCSLLVAQTLVPMLCSKILELNEGKNENRGFLRTLFDKTELFFEGVENRYRRLLRWAITHRKAVVAVMVLFLVISIALVPFVGAEFFPDTDRGQITVDVELAPGTQLEKTGEVISKIEKIAMDIPEVEIVASQVGTSTMKSVLGTSESEIGNIDIKLVPLKERKRSSKKIAEEIRQKIGDVPGAEIKVSSASLLSTASSMSGSGDKPVQIGIKGDNFDALEDIADAVAAIVKEVPGTREVDTTLSEGRPEFRIHLNRDKASLYGLNAASVASAVRSAVSGSTATQYRVAGTEVDIVIQYEETARETIENIKSMTIASPLGINVPLRDIVELEITEGPNAIDREDQERIVYVTADIFGRDLNSVMRDIGAKISGLHLPEGYTIEFKGQHEEMTEAFQGLALALILAVILVYMIMASQFESLLHPFTIMFAVPFALIGVVFAMALTRRAFSVPAFIGVIMLAGIAVNNAIVLIDYINQLRSRGLERDKAVLQAGPVRLRPVLMTTLTTVLGLFPLSLGLGESGSTQAPLATAVIGGLLVSTFLTLVAVPTIYTIFDDWGAAIQGYLGKIFQKKQDSFKHV